MFCAKTKLNKLMTHIMPGGFKLIAILLINLVYSLIVCWIDLHAVASTQLFQATAAISVSAVFGLLLIFRNNSAYERWWEARKLWGQLVNDSRNLSIKVQSYVVQVSQLERTQFAEMIASFSEVLRHHLRGIRDTAALERLEISDYNQHIPSAIALTIYKTLKRWHTQGFVSDWEQLQLDFHARALIDICGATERILKSPITGSHKLLFWMGLWLNLLCLPWFLAPTFHWITIAITFTTSYFTFGIEMLAEEVERPFDDNVNDLPLDQICATIRKSVFDILHTSGSYEVKSTFDRSTK